MLLFDVVRFGLLFVFVWVVVWLLHEWCHVLEGFRLGASHGVITVRRFGFVVSCDVGSCWSFLLAGGLYCSLICFLVSCVVSDVFLRVLFVSFGVLQVVYGVFEMMFLPVLSGFWYRFWRYVLYVVVLCCCLVVWVVFF